MTRIGIALLFIANALLHFRVNGQTIDTTSTPTATTHHLCPKSDDYSGSGSSSGDLLKPDHFRKLGRVAEMSSCIKKCCNTRTCDLAMMSLSSKQCYGVACFDENLCAMLPSYPSRVSFDVAHVRRK